MKYTESPLLLRLTKEDKENLIKLAKSKRMTLSGYIRNQLLN